MESSSNSPTLYSHRFLLTDHISPDYNHHSRNIRFDRIVFAIMVAAISLSIIFFILFKRFCRSDCSSDENPTVSRPSVDSELKQIPVLVYGESTSEVESCAICLEEYVKGEKVRVLPRCKHMFHKECIEEWFEVPSLHCPICRDRVLEHCLQSARSDNCRTQRHHSDNQLHPLALYGTGIRNTYV
ncbi:RING-H2 finger protein ATL74-like [Hibiscus syriacus]|uniref:RING-H2 finger protein ATL74-like n=1 Tax=Hibiscus syriacus TaxID=106335 RepID=UPI001921E8D1|nr:RING-H2 finger protein ATL74-like [Hibiscus syriacus]